VILYGSRADDNVTPDRYQDYDIIFVVADKGKFDFSVFENVKMKFKASEAYPELFQGETACLMLFDDDSRIDLTVCTMEVFISNHANGQAMKCFLDKDNNLGKLIKIDNSIHNIKKIDETAFNNACAEFFWEIQNGVKGLKRDELSFAMFLRDISMRDMLNIMVDNYIGLENNYSVTTGTLGKYRKIYLSDELYEIYRKTYLSNTIGDIWASLNYMIDLFSLTGMKIAETHGYHYPKADESYMRDYIMRMMESAD
jgi:aminoglycoside 6-adenylyltransferase